MFSRLVPIVAILLAASPARAANARSSWVNNLAQVAWGIRTYDEINHQLPEDQGRPPRLSWRVAVLPYIEQDNLSKLIQAKQIQSPPTPPPFVSVFFANHEPRVSGMAAPRGLGTIWGNGGRQSLTDLKRDPATLILLVSVDEHLAPIWDEPGDLPYDRAAPKRGLKWFSETHTWVAFADGTVRSIPKSISDDLLRQLFDRDAERPARWKLGWFEAMTQTEMGFRIFPALAFGVACMVGLGLAVCRLMWKNAVSPGEMLCMILGAHQLVYWINFARYYDLELLTPAHHDQHELAYWFWPRAAACLATCVAFLCFRYVPVWRVFFMTLLVALVLVTLDARFPHQFRSPEESLATSIPPFLMCFAGLVTLLLLHQYDYPGVARRSKLQWTGIVLTFLPLLWFSACQSQGLAEFREMFMRTLT